ncbi:MAG: hypothetical protein ACE5PO_08340, partial [Candidatus Bathyarchaeia archaeon]
YTVEALWNELWAVKVESQYGNPQGEGYYPRGSTAKISVTSPAIIVPNESRMVFNGWTGDINSPNVGVEIPVDGYKVVKANWVQEYYVRVVSTYGNPSGSGWYRAGSTATFTVDPEESAGIGRTAVFERWSGDYRGSDPSAQVTVNSPMSVLAHWTTDNSALYLFISSIMATVAGSTIYLRKSQISTLKKGPIKMFKKDQSRILKKRQIRMPKKNEAKRSKKKRK